MELEPELELKSTPIKNWPPSTLLALCKKTAGGWWKEIAFNSGGPLDDIDDRAQELLCKILENLDKSDEGASDQIAQFYRLASYCKPGMIQSCYSVPTHEIDEDRDEADYCCPDDRPEAEDLEDLLKLIGVSVSGHDYSLFLSENSDWEAATGLSERDLRNFRARRKKQIVDKVLCNKLALQKLFSLFPKLRAELAPA